MNPDIIFVGAGPIGLWTAIQLKIHLPDINILMLEKYQQYQRHHILIVDKSSLDNIPCDYNFRHMARQFIGKISTSMLETTLLKFAQNIGIMINYSVVINCSELLTQYPSVRVIIGSDGSHSIVRKQIFNDNMDANYNLQYLVNVTYGIAGPNNKLSWSEWAETLTKAHFYIREHDEISDQTKITLRMFIDPNTYEAIKDATFKNPLGMEQIKEKSPALYDTINLWLDSKRKFVGEQVIIPPKISAVRLDVYKSKDVINVIPSAELKHPMNVTQKHDSVVWCLVGDSAFGVPFFRSLNDGMLTGTMLALKLSQYLISQENGFMTQLRNMFGKANPLKEYQDYFDEVACKEMSMADIKSKAMEISLSASYGSAVMSNCVLSNSFSMFQS
jgi:hypothetical protein